MGSGLGGKGCRMRRPLRCTAGGLAAIAAMVVAAPVYAQAPVQDSVTGQLFSEQVGLIFVVDGRSGPSGENPTGTVGWSIGGGLGPGWGGTVTCLAVSDRAAVIGFSGTHNPGFDEPLHPVAGLIRVVDGGGLESGLDSFEWAEAIGPSGGPPIPGPTDCSTYPSIFRPALFSPVVNQFGDLFVTDAKSLPSTKDQCRNEGWRDYGAFRNQGDCVSFIASGGKSPPALESR
jgi:hypothetical protein